ncbi:cat eye syndrome critical region protein 1 [Corynespora cassiicola Philippines]|uniref:Cat eye syndrome critical region protein 1 n=1 Tax=Corynespora cassiicola Philippines TaxID=1448308 RepID=A0A2T2MZR1_CORCC|nr:cat eye syndrome critical region protein 1 [Corynespora cassiicola Philippines]
MKYSAASHAQNAKKSFDISLDRKDGIKVIEKCRKKLLRAEERARWDHEAFECASETEKEADSIMRALRVYENEEIFCNLPGETLPPKDSRDMGGKFLANKGLIEKLSKLFRIAMELPKGAVLHLHFNAVISPARLLEQARGMENMYIKSTIPLLCEDDLEAAEIVFGVQDATKIRRDVNIFAKTYDGTKNEEHVWMKLSKFRREFKKLFAARDQQSQQDEEVDIRLCAVPEEWELDIAESWIMEKMTLNEREVYDPAQTVNGVWARFNQATRCFKGLLNNESAYRWYIGKAIDSLIQDKVMYAELRPMLLDKWIPTNDGKGRLNNTQQMQIIVESVAAKKVALRERNALDKFPFGLKIIYCTPRSISKKRMREELKDCLDLKCRFPDLICGFDLVGAEDRPNHIGYYRDELVAFRKVCEQHGLDIPFLFHAGETLLDTGGSKCPSNSNLFDAVALGAKRVGHGYSLLKHSQLVKKFKLPKARDGPGICIELCPISNELLHLCRNIREHPYTSLLAAGVPCTLNTDNQNLFSNSMSHEFYQVLVGDPLMSIHGWKQLSRWSLEYSCLSPEDKNSGLKIHSKSWEEFCRRVVEIYGGLVKDGHINRAEARNRYAIGSKAWIDEDNQWNRSRD